jgi:hypothetical protein
MGDKPGHPFRGNQYAGQAGAVEGFTHTARIAAAGPNLEHLAKENKIPANPALAFDRAGERMAAQRPPRAPRDEAEAMVSAARRAEHKALKETKSAEQALHEYRLANPRKASAGFRASPEEKKLINNVRAERKGGKTPARKKDKIDPYLVHRWLSPKKRGL